MARSGHRKPKSPVEQALDLLSSPRNLEESKTELHQQVQDALDRVRDPERWKRPLPVWATPQFPKDYPPPDQSEGRDGEIAAWRVLAQALRNAINAIYELDIQRAMQQRYLDRKTIQQIGYELKDVLRGEIYSRNPVYDRLKKGREQVEVSLAM